jgi:hypothetical protein
MQSIITRAKLKIRRFNLLKTHRKKMGIRAIVFKVGKYILKNIERVIEPDKKA